MGYLTAVTDDASEELPNYEGIDIKFSEKTKYMSIECELGSKNAKKETVMIDTGASLSLVDSSVPFVRELSTNMNLRFGNGSTQVTSSKRLICICK